jgi:hypothetical protein
VFARPDGRPLTTNSDYHEWKNLLAEAGLRDTRLLDARHTAEAREFFSDGGRVRLWVGGPRLKASVRPSPAVVGGVSPKHLH